ncbi:AraC family transcriptional regulator [Obesumbacterium proteus]|uniref:AraC/XylS family transcriptional regulator n=1 Tax=Obesumbacterium proteus ATCC 12841 TaxID=1354268 RepID=A0AA91IMU2_9GAMM|nr:AraC family transcriptional regulator [Obesumbacterium proteus]OAT57100.1 AraC/XylS family transcriptional regulator [Obesumbacterium proteus ATCC 12841]
MYAISHTEQRLTNQEIIARCAHSLHRITLFTPALCHVRVGSKTVQWGDHVEIATPHSLILFPAGAEISIANTPRQGLYISDMIYVPELLLRKFRQLYSPATLEPSMSQLCIPFDGNIQLMWQGLLNTLQAGTPMQLQQHQLYGVLLALSLSGHGEILFRNRNDPLTAQVQQVLLRDPARSWSVNDVAQQLHLGSSTLRRRLAAENQGFRSILESVRMGKALYELQSSTHSIGEIAFQGGYSCASRFSARFAQHFVLTPSALRQAMKLHSNPNKNNNTDQVLNLTPVMPPHNDKN